MDAIVENLPYSSYGSELYVIYDENEGNTMNTLQVDIAKSKGWKVYHCTGKYYIEEYDAYEENWEEYSGSEPGSEILRGDVNGNDVVNGTDIQAIINIIVAGEYNKNADVNEDGNVNGTDIQEVINIIVNEE